MKFKNYFIFVTITAIFNNSYAQCKPECKSTFIDYSTGVYDNGV